MDPNLEFAEEWLPVVGAEGYQVSNFGRVQSLPRIVRGQQIRGCIMRPRMDDDGYLRVTFPKDGKRQPWGIHALMAEAFIGPRPPGHTVDHKDGVKLNNVLGNLEYVTPQEQTRRAMALGLHFRNPHGEKNTMAKLSDADVIEIRRLYLEGMTQRALAEQFGVGQTQISRIVNRKRRRFTSEGQEL